MILLGTPISAADASAAGLLAGIFEPGTVFDNVLETASKLAGMSPMALSLAKEAVCRCKKLIPLCCFPFVKCLVASTSRGGHCSPGPAGLLRPAGAYRGPR